MLSLALVNAPFASLRLPSLALTQLKSALDATLAASVSTEVLYLNHDFAENMGVDLYQHIAVDMEAPYNGFGDWFFRQAAFPELPDNVDVYFQRYFPKRSAQNQTLKETVQNCRRRIPDLLDELITRYRLDERDLVGFTSMFSQNVACFALARRIKERNPHGLIVMGGANCETPMGEEIVRNIASIDFVFSGCALKSLPDFLRACLDGDAARRERIQGVYSKCNCRNLLSSANGTIGEELPLDVPVALDYDAFLESLERRFPGMDPILLFETSRGCWWGQKAHCTFCGLNGQSMNYRAMSPSIARDLIASLFKYSSKVSRLQCVDNIMPKTYPKEVFARLDTPANMKIFYEVKADLSDEDMQLLARARVKEVQPGIESLATSTLKLMKKGTTVFQNLRFLSMCLTYDIFPCWSLLVGFPGERAAVYEKYLSDIPQIVHLPPPSGVYPVRPDRYSPYQVRAQEFGLDLHPTDFYEIVYPFKPQVLRNLAYFFRDRNFSADYFVAMVEWFDRVREQVELWRRRWNPAIHGQPPLLYLKKSEVGSPVVHDTRAGALIEHHISSAGHVLLQQLAKPRTRAEIEAERSHETGVSFAAELAILEDLGLLFQEGEHVVSLVLAEKPSWNETLSGWSWAA